MQSRRQRIRTTLDLAAARLGVLERRLRELRGSCAMLTYHRVFQDPEAASQYPFASICIDLMSFRSHVETLRTVGDLCTVREAVSSLPSRSPSSPPLICITFDDGYDDNFLVAADCLGSMSAPATFFVVTQFVAGSLGSLWFDLAARCWETCRRSCTDVTGRAEDDVMSRSEWITWLKQPAQSRRAIILSALATKLGIETHDPRFRAMTIDQLIALDRAGHEIGSHTASHPMLDQLDEECLDTELRESLRDLRAFGIESPTGIAYPNGNTSHIVQTATRDAGYSYGLTTRPGANHRTEDRYRMRRYDTDPRWTTGRKASSTAASILGEVSGFHDALRRSR